MTAAHVLVVDDEPDIRALVQEILEDEGYEVSVAADAEAARLARRARRPDLILLDIWMPDTDGITLLKEWSQSQGLDTPILMMSGHATVETAVEATRLGAYDFIEKPLSLAKLLLTVKRALEADKLAQENVGLRRQSEPVSEPIGQSELMTTLRERIRRIAEHEAAVLVTGEAGTGKQTVARYLHQHSRRKTGPFIRMPGTSLSAENAAGELFGVEDGLNVHFGSLEKANGGTLLLDDVADMHLAIQTRLSGALEHGSFLRVGGTEAVAVNTRIVAATSLDLAEAVRAGRFREDLYYQLNVVSLRVPSIRERLEDLPAILEFIVDHLISTENFTYRPFSVGAQNRLRNHPWPGNIRELRNVVQRILMLGSNSVVEAEEVDFALGGTTTATDESTDPQIPSVMNLPFKEAREQFEKAYLEHQLRELDSNISQVAQRIGIERTHLYRKLKALGIDPRRLARN